MTAEVLDQIRALTEKAKADKNRIEESRQAQIVAQKKLREAQAELNAPLRFNDRLLPRIREVAALGMTNLECVYSDNNFIEAQAIAKYAQSLGFKTRFSCETTDHGDSAAPCIVECHYLVISWE